ncbi:MAG: hypothetical protein AB8G16_09860 [Gammaproteobacteria bacterium]
MLSAKFATGGIMPYVDTGGMAKRGNYRCECAELALSVAAAPNDRY